MQSKSKTTPIRLYIVSYLGIKLWNDDAILCNELFNEDFLAFKWPKFIYHYIWRFPELMKSHIMSFLFSLKPCFLHLSPSPSFKIILLWSNYPRLWFVFTDQSWLYICIFRICFTSMAFLYVYIYALYVSIDKEITPISFYGSERRSLPIVSIKTTSKRNERTRILRKK